MVKASDVSNIKKALNICDFVLDERIHDENYHQSDSKIDINKYLPMIKHKYNFIL